MCCRGTPHPLVGGFSLSRLSAGSIVSPCFASQVCSNCSGCSGTSDWAAWKRGSVPQHRGNSRAAPQGCHCAVWPAAGPSCGAAGGCSAVSGTNKCISCEKSWFSHGFRGIRKAELSIKMHVERCYSVERPFHARCQVVVVLVLDFLLWALIVLLVPLHVITPRISENRWSWRKSRGFSFQRIAIESYCRGKKNKKLFQNDLVFT